MPERKFLFSGAYLDEHKNAFGDDDCVMLLLSPTAFFLLANMSRMLLWKTRYEEGIVPDDAREYYRQMNNPSCINIDVSVGMGELVDPMTALINAIVEKELEMINNQTVNVGCGCSSCGGCGCSGGANTEYDEMPPDDFDVDEVDVVEPDEVVAGDDKCDIATYLLVDYRNMCLEVSEMVTSYEVFRDWFDARVISWLTSWIPAGAFSYSVYLQVKAWAGLSKSTLKEDFLDAYDPNFDAMVCSLYSSPTVVGGKSAVRDILENYVWSKVGTFGRLVLKSVFEAYPFEVAFDSQTSVDIPPGYQNRTCCGGVELDGTELLPEMSSGYEYIPTTYVSYDSGDEPSSAVGEGNKAVITWKNEADNPWGVGLTVNYDVGVPELEGKQHVGFIVWVESNVLTEGRHVDIPEGEFWGNDVSGSNEHADVELSEGSDLYYISVYAFGDIADDIGALMGELGDRNNTGTFHDGSFTTYGNMYTSQNDDVSGVLTVRTWHIVRDVE